MKKMRRFNGLAFKTGLYTFKCLTDGIDKGVEHNRYYKKGDKLYSDSDNEVVYEIIFNRLFIIW